MKLTRELRDLIRAERDRYVRSVKRQRERLDHELERRARGGPRKRPEARRSGSTP